MEKIKITNRQFLCLTFGVSLGGAVLVVASLMADIAKQDAWIGAIVSILAGFPVVGILVFLGRRFPHMNYMEILRAVWGSWAGTLVAGSSILLWLQLSFHIPWYVGDFITSQTMPETPYYVITGLYIGAIAIAVRYGLEAFSRAFEIFTMISVFLFIFAAVLLLPNAHIENLQPVLENGFPPVLKSAFFMSCFVTYPLYVLMMVYPCNVKNIKSAGKSMFKGYLLSGTISFLSILLSIMVLGWPITANSRYPAFRLAKEIDVGVIFSRIEFIVFLLWILTQSIVNTLYFYSAVKGISQLIKLKNHKRMILPLALIVFILSGVVFPDVIYQEHWIVFVWAPYIFIHGFVFPLLTLIVYLIRERLKKKLKNPFCLTIDREG